MPDLIHSSKEEAKRACEEYVKEIQSLQERFGTWEENDDSCVMTFVYTRYRDESGEIKKYSLF